MRDVPEWFCTALIVLAESYPSMRLREMTYRAYYAVLSDLPEAQVLAAIKRAPVEHPTFFPSAGDLRALVTGKPDDVAMMAWESLHHAAEAIGAYGSLTCDDPATGRAVEQVFGSWPQFCEECVDVATREWLARRQEFLTAHREQRRQRLPGAMPHRLVGLCEVENNSDGTASSWGGRLTVKGDVIAERVRKSLPASPDLAALPEATFEDER